MPTNSDRADDSDPADTLDLERSAEIQIGVTRGEHDLEIGPPRDYPDRADVSVRSSADGVVLSVDAMAGDHGTGHVDATLTPDEARDLSERLAAAVETAEDGRRED